MKDLKKFLEESGIEFHDISLYEMAFTHASYQHEHYGSCKDYDRLEFVGDGVLDLIIAKLIYEACPTKNSGSLSKMRSSLVRGPALSKYARDFHFEKYIRISNGELRNSDNKIQDRILEDVFEAFIGAYYLDNGYDKVYKMIEKIFMVDIDGYDENTIIFDYKSKLQEIVQGDCKGQVVYEVLLEEGNPQNKHFEIAAKIDEVVLGVGNGSSKKRAEQDAAKNALEKRVTDGSI